MSKAFIKTYGCQMNQQDSDQMMGLLAKVGYQKASQPDQADVILLVTCTVRDKAEQKVYSELGRLRPLVEENPKRVIGIAGCLAQQEKNNLTKRFPYLDLVFGPDAIGQLPQMVQNLRDQKENQKNSQPIVATQFKKREDFEFVDVLPTFEQNRHQAFVNIQKGCDNVCSFCIVPHVRGAEVSRPSAQIIDEIQKLVDLGVSEVTLLGQNVNSYGFKRSSELNFTQLVYEIAKKTKVKRLRFTSSHPKDVGDDLILAFKELEILCPHFHLPVQSGSDRILQEMRRFYTRAEYLDKIAKLKKARPGIVFTSDIIVGFPTETANDFEQTLSLLNEVPFEQSFSFVYSARPKTKALKMRSKDDLQTQKQRLEILQTRQRQISARQNKLHENTMVEVLVEKFDPIKQTWSGRTPTNKIVHFKQNSGKIEDIHGKYLNVWIHQSNPHSLLGEIKTNE